MAKERAWRRKRKRYWLTPELRRASGFFFVFVFLKQQPTITTTIQWFSDTF